MIRHTLLIIALMSFTLLHSCGLTDDRESKTKDYLQQKIVDESDNALKLESFAKTNGMELEVMGMKMYGLEWTAQVSVQNDVWKTKNNILGDWYDFKITTKKPEGDIFGDLHLSAGTNIHFTGKCEFQKTEKGWIVYSFEVDSYEILNKTSASSK